MNEWFMMERHYSDASDVFLVRCWTSYIRHLLPGAAIPRKVDYYSQRLTNAALRCHAHLPLAASRFTPSRFPITNLHRIPTSNPTSSPLARSLPYVQRFGHQRAFLAHLRQDHKATSGLLLHLTSSKSHLDRDPRK